MRPRILVFLLVPALLGARVGRAESVEAKERRARTACLGGDYAKGVQLLSELFVATLDAAFIYNQGRCFEQNRRYEDAIARFQEYLRAERKLTKAAKAEADKHIADCKELLASEKAASVPAPTAVPPLPQPEPAAAHPTPEVVVPAVHEAAAPAGNGSSGLRIAGITAASLGGAALIAGIVFNIKSNSLASDLKKTDGYTGDKESDRKTYQTLGWVGYGVGAACIATGAVLYVLGVRSGSDGAVSLTPEVGPGLAGASLGGAF
jgi:hypothetical protein